MRAAAFFQHQENQNTDGGTATSGSWEDRKITNIISDLNSMISLNAGTGIITAQPGSYIFDAVTPFYGVNLAQSRLVNAVSGAVLLNGTNALAGNGLAVMNISKIQGVLTFSTVTTIKIQSRVQSTQASSGYGLATNLAAEVYTTGSISVLG